MTCDNCRVLAETVKTLGEALAARDRKTVSTVSYPVPPVTMGFEPQIEAALARKAGGDDRLLVYLQSYATGALASGMTPDEVAQAIIDGEVES